MNNEDWVWGEEESLLRDIENDINNAKGKEDLEDFIMSELYEGFDYGIYSLAINPFTFRYYFKHATWAKATESVVQKLRSKGYITYLKIEDDYTIHNPTYIIKLTDRLINELEADENDEF